MFRILILFICVILLSRSSGSELEERDECLNYLEEFRCPEHSLSLVDYLPDPNLCNVYHKCYKGTEIGRVCCSDRQIFSLKHQTCIESLENQKIKCEFSHCALRYFKDICVYNPQAAASVPVAQCPTETINNTIGAKVTERDIPDCSPNSTSVCLSCHTVSACIYVDGEYNIYNDTCLPETPVCVDGMCEAYGITPICVCGTNMSTGVDPYNDHFYVMCVGDEIFYIDCGDEYYDGVSGCTSIPPTTTPSAPPCTEAGAFPIDCHNYEICTAVGEVPIVETCPDGEIFNNATASCQTLPAEFTCTETGAFLDPYDCKRYYICSGTEIVDTECCPSDQIFDNIAKACVPDDGSCITLYQCKP